MIPEVDAETGNLPPGVHPGTWHEVNTRFGMNVHRRWLLRGLREMLENRRSVGCQRIYLNGSFVTAKETPGDFDACCSSDGIVFEDLELLFPELLDFSNGRASQKAKYGGEMFPANAIADIFGTRFVDFFQRDADTGETKGIIEIDLSTLP